MGLDCQTLPLPDNLLSFHPAGRGCIFCSASLSERNGTTALQRHLQTDVTRYNDKFTSKELRIIVENPPCRNTHNATKFLKESGTTTITWTRFLALSQILGDECTTRESLSPVPPSAVNQGGYTSSSASRSQRNGYKCSCILSIISSSPASTFPCLSLKYLPSSCSPLCLLFLLP